MRASRGPLRRWCGNGGYERIYWPARFAGAERARRARDGGSGEDELFRRAGGRRAWWLGRVPEGLEDFAHDGGGVRSSGGAALVKRK